MAAKAERPREVLATIAHGPDGQTRYPGQRPADEWYDEQHAWYLEDLRRMDPPRLVEGDEDLELASVTAGFDVSAAVNLSVSGNRGRAGSSG